MPKIVSVRRVFTVGFKSCVLECEGQDVDNGILLLWGSKISASDPENDGAVVVESLVSHIWGVGDVAADATSQLNPLEQFSCDGMRLRIRSRSPLLRKSRTVLVMVVHKRDSRKLTEE